MSKLKPLHPTKFRADASPMHYRLQQEIRRRIENGQWVPGSVIPPERKMAQESAVSLGTVRTAILNLVSEGLLYRIQGKGTLVSGTRMIRENIRYYRFTEDFGRREAVPQLRFLDLAKVEGRPEINRRLKTDRAEELYRLRRLVLISRRPAVFSVSFLPCRLFAGLEEFPRSRFEKVPLYLALEDHFGLPTLSNSELISVVSAETEEASMLCAAQGTPILAVEMLAFTYRNRPYEYRISYCRTEGRKLLRNY
jgi:DNA-binding GntR family transcriptional regulator